MRFAQFKRRNVGGAMVRGRQWTGFEAAALQEAMRRSVRDFADLLGIEATTVVNWRTGLSAVKPRFNTQAILDTTLEQRATDEDRVRFEQLVTEGEVAWRARHRASDPVDPLPAFDQGGDPTDRRNVLRAMGVGGIAIGADVGGVVLDAARESARLVNVIDRSSVDPSVLLDAADDLYQLSTDYAVDPDLEPIFLRLTVLRDQLAATIQRAGRVRDLEDLHVLFAATCALLASVSHDLAQPRAAMIQTRAAGRFAELTGHQSLLAWVYCTRAMIVSWWGQPEQVLREVGRAGGISGIPGIRLSGLAARAHAQRGDRPSALAAVAAARRERDNLSAANDLIELGPIFDFSHARQHYYDATTFALLGEWASVRSEAEAVISLYSPRQVETWPATLTLAQLNLSRALLHTEGAAEAFDALRPVLEIPVGQRIPQVATAVRAVRGDLCAHSAAATAHGRTLRAAVEAFLPDRMTEAVDGG
ncbi:hypothetical protein [Nocardia blacklockiae]|uniref:hypothetical protein n=1 Tax=Nocardia blacklockiae TaxID=480036 RepID=UPI00189576AB|nr:hypothetical protein [Nocardia blacklockiae]MBF6169985.1 hypothetical protein [Nocardia blacklockiae]